ncbi:MAG: hypothetical protein ACFCUT_13210 [Kiloniellaceae bacterium]
MADKNRSEIDKSDLNVGAGKASQPMDQESPEVRARREARRRVLAGGLASAPLILTLSSRPASAVGGGYWGGGKNCGPSSMLSGNLSNNAEPEGCRGKTPGYWKTHADKCSKYFVVGPCNPIDKNKWGTCDDYSVPKKKELEDYLTKLKKDRWKNKEQIQTVEQYLDWLKRYPNLDSPPFGTAFSDVFGSGFTQDHTTTMMQALWLADSPSGSGGPAPILAHCAAAYCNAYEFGKSTFGLSPQEVVDLVASMIHVDPFGLKDLLEAMNERG